MTNSDKPTRKTASKGRGQKTSAAKAEDAEILEEGAGPKPEEAETPVADDTKAASVVDATPESDSVTGDQPEQPEPPQTDGAASVEAKPDAETGESGVDAAIQQPGDAEPEGKTSADNAPKTETGDASAASENETAATHASSIPPTLPVTTPVEQPRMSRGPGFFTLLLGGLLAGAIGYALAYYTEFRPFAGPKAEDPRDAIIANLESTVEANSARFDALAEKVAGVGTQSEGLGAQISALEQRVTELTPGEEGIPPAILDQLRSAAQDEVKALGARVDAVEAEGTKIEEQVASVAEKVASISSQISEVGGVDPTAATEALNAYQRQLAALQTELDSQRASVAEAAKLTESARAQQNAILAEASLARVQAAVLGGGGFEAALSELSAATEVEIPEVLIRVAPGGVSTLPQLQSAFEPAARAALEASIAASAGQGTAAERLGNFLRAQTGARSLTEREGDDPDAVLSRARARVVEDDLPAAIDEIAKLPEPGQQAMSDWVADAKTRLAAVAAVSDLADAIGAR